MENNTPPIGEPKATATPAALAAVTISLILPRLPVRLSLLRAKDWTDFEFAGSCRIIQQPTSQYSMLRVPMGLPYRLRGQKQSPAATKPKKRVKTLNTEMRKTGHQLE
jgi:hypothetical protein